MLGSAEVFVCPSWRSFLSIYSLSLSLMPESFFISLWPDLGQTPETGSQREKSLFNASSDEKIGAFQDA